MESYSNDLMLDIVVMDFEALDTRKQDDTLTGKFISELILKLISYVAANERENIMIDRCRVLLLQNCEE